MSNFNITNKNSAFAQSQIKRLIARYGAVKKKLEQQLKQLENRQKLESTHAEIYNLYGLEHLPVEVAVNIVCLMGYFPAGSRIHEWITLMIVGMAAHPWP